MLLRALLRSELIDKWLLKIELVSLFGREVSIRKVMATTTNSERQAGKIINK